MVDDDNSSDCDNSHDDTNVSDSNPSTGKTVDDCINVDAKTI